MSQQLFEQPSKNRKRKKTAGISTLDILDLPDQERQLVNWIMRQGEVSFAEIAARIDQGEQAARSAIADLIARGILQEEKKKDQQCYRVLLVTKAKRPVADIWKALD